MKIVNQSKGAFEITISWTISVILNQIAKNKSFENYIFKKLRFENVKNYIFKSQLIEYFFENVKF
jgi:hypothetical protein